MPLLDHFQPPLSERRHWEAFHARWASAIADSLNEHGLPENFFAEPTVHIGGQVQVDVDSFEVHVINNEGGPRLVAAIELVSPRATRTARNHAADSPSSARITCSRASLAW